MDYETELTRHVPAKVSRRTLVGSAAAIVALSSWSSFAAQDATPASQAEGEDDAVAILESAGQELMELDTFHFALTTIAGSSSVFPGMSLESVEGSVRRPMDLTATVRASALMQTVEVNAVAVDGVFYIQNPLSGGAWEKFTGAGEISGMINPDWIIVAAVNLIKDATITDQNDEETLIEGYLNFAETLEDAGAATSDLGELEQFLANSPIDVAIWINADNLINRVELYGPIFASESPDVEKRIELSAFNEPVEIEVPEI